MIFRGNAKLIESMFAGQAGLIRAALGQDSHTKATCQDARCTIHFTGQPPRCHKLIMYPNSDGGWSRIVCPALKTHEGLHMDDNYFPFFSDEDADWLNTQYETWKAGHDSHRPND